MPEKKEIYEMIADAIKSQANKRKPKDIVEDFMKIAVSGAIADHLTKKGRIKSTLIPAMKRTIISEFRKIPDVPMTVEYLEKLFDDTVREVLNSCDSSRMNRSGIVTGVKEMVVKTPAGIELPGGGLILT